MTRPLAVGVQKGAELDATGRYRWRLWREWALGYRCLFVMLNPSTADADRDDPTIRRCIGFVRRWGYGSLEVCNLFALRATDPRELLRAIAQRRDPVGEGNDWAIAEAAHRASFIVAAWGASGEILKRGQIVAAVLRRYRPLFCLGLTAHGHPRHPLRVPGDVVAEEWRSA